MCRRAFLAPPHETTTVLPWRPNHARISAIEVATAVTRVGQLWVSWSMSYRIS